MAEVIPGTVLAGKYLVERVLGQGGIGKVFQARHLQLDDSVAIKVLLPGALSSLEMRARFITEAKAARRIKSEHVAKVTDVGELPEDGAPYMVMELLDGYDLARVLEKRGALPVPEAVDYLLQACEALAEAHALGIVHRDIKPANLFLTSRFDGSPCVKLLDFGIAKIQTSGPAMASITHAQAMLGTVLYAAPEQLQSAKFVDHRSDIWSLGATLFQLITGQPPFTAEDLGQLLTKVLTSSPKSLHHFIEDAPANVERAIATCLEKNASLRFPNVVAFAATIAPAAGNPEAARLSLARMSRSLNVFVPEAPTAHGALPPVDGVAATLVTADQLRADQLTQQTPSAVEREAIAAEQARRHAPRWWVVAAVALLVAGAAGVFLFSRDTTLHPPQATATPSPTLSAPAALAPASASAPPASTTAASVLAPAADPPTRTTGPDAAVSIAVQQPDTGRRPASTLASGSRGRAPHLAPVEPPAAPPVTSPSLPSPAPPPVTAQVPDFTNRQE